MQNMTILQLTMRGIFIVLLMSVGWLSYSQKEPVETEKGYYKIAIKTSAICDMCQYTLEEDLTFEKGVKKAVLNLDDKVMTIVYNPRKTNPYMLRKRIAQVGYHADWVERVPQAYEKLPLCCKDGSRGTPVPQVPLKRDN